ncbi:signal peptide peptidase-like 2 isoform X2 [Stegostoma tigrinum]|uniref:signal peptide peptidase-like 2 isoform X2 n=1 Tax=Stegostoma tigrinum TaxID=3053191 RepID=UPI0028704A5D|nr:signal peptide peptidase-like 2 isoform X2 [Stegostoma tigrinum]
MALGVRLLLFVLQLSQVVTEYGMVHVLSDKEHGNTKDYCIQFNPYWAYLPHDLSKASVLQLQDLTASDLCTPSDVPLQGFSNRIAMVMRGNCTFYEKVRLAQINGAKGLLIVSRQSLVPPGGNGSQYEEIDIPVALLSYDDMLDISKTFGKSIKVAMYAPNEPFLDYNMVVIFVMAVGTVAIGGYWAGSKDVKKRYMKNKHDGADKQDDETVDVTPIMICIFVVMCCSMLVLLYYFYHQLVYVIIGIFCLASSIGLYSCLSPFVGRISFCECRIPDLPCSHKRPQVRMLFLGMLCVSISCVWAVFRNEDKWAWVLQDTLGIAFCLYMLKTIRLPTFKSGESIMMEVAAGPSDFSTQEKLPMVLKVPRLNSSPLALCDRPFSLLGFGDVLIPGMLVAYCHRFDIQAQTSRIYFVACTIAYGIGLLITFLALALMQTGQPALLYLVPCTLITSICVACWRKEVTMFWNGSGFATSSQDVALCVASLPPSTSKLEELPSQQISLASDSCAEPCDKSTLTTPHHEKETLTSRPAEFTGSTNENEAKSSENFLPKDRTSQS